MKNLIKIYSRYILSACLLLLLLAAANFIFLAASVLHYTSYYEDGSSLGSMGSIALPYDLAVLSAGQGQRTEPLAP